MPVDRQAALRWFEALAQLYTAHREQLTDLDRALGDADHGANLERGFAVIQAEFAARPPTDLHSVFQTAGALLIRTVGGAAGPLYGTFFVRAAASCRGQSELDSAAVVALFQAGIEGVRARGKAESGDKTMLDALLPALAAMHTALENRHSLAEILDAGAAAARAGMLATIPLEARKGRASYLGPRSIGHQDPGATSSCLLLEAAARAWRA